MATSTSSTMKESNGMMAVTTHVHARTDLLDIMNAFHRKLIGLSPQSNLVRRTGSNILIVYHVLQCTT